MLGGMSTLELAALLAGYALAMARLLNAARPLWAWVPVKLQPLLPALVTVLPLLASQLGAATTRLDMTESGILALGALMTAVRGQHPVPPVALVLLFLGFTGLAGCSSLARVTPADRAAGYTAQAKAAELSCRAYVFDRAHGLVDEVPAMVKLCAGE